MNVKKTKSSKKIVLKITMSMTVDQVVHRQPLLEDVPKVLLGVLRPKQGGIDDL